jgi:protein-tyrosine-phosphatase
MNSTSNGQINKVLCVCIGNGDRSPFMAAVLRLLTEKVYDITAESAGVSPNITVGMPHASAAVLAGERFGFDIHKSTRRRVQDLKLADYGLFITVSDQVGEKLMEIATQQHVDISRMIANLNVANPYPVGRQAMYDEKVIPYVFAEMANIVRWYENALNKIPLAGKTEKMPLVA